jgi:hypothetical protein
MTHGTSPKVAIIDEILGATQWDGARGEELGARNSRNWVCINNVLKLMTCWFDNV